MGAYGEGSIRKLCALTPPQTGIITALGEAHYERFKSLDTVARAKFELAEAVLANETGTMVIHENVLAVSIAADFVQKHRNRFIVCGQGAEADCRTETIEQTRSGLTVALQWKGSSYNLDVPLFGAPHAGNITLAFATAVTLGLTPERVVAALRTVPQIQHRLEVKPQANGSTYIDDAFNSNPAGFTAALELMTLLAGGKARRIIVTPGLVELGDKHNSVHEALGAATARNADIVLAVRPERIRAFIDGFVAAKSNGTLTPVANLAEAQKWLTENAKPDDIVLIENDLPDVYERKMEV
jgi:UDP-N-acetylmuramoyl-tripeptide--D-alanyl-D-alanine ligase